MKQAELQVLPAQQGPTISQDLRLHAQRLLTITQTEVVAEVLLQAATARQAEAHHPAPALAAQVAVEAVVQEAGGEAAPHLAAHVEEEDNI